ncbi:MAG: transporter substrate-binding domain-containing protein, partial [Burkholderiales bacterium]|nr:transporter substrate-binding domain-containing protein [Burkholderiales bacterium]
MKLSVSIACLLGASVFASAVPAMGAEELTGTLKKIKETGTITLGVRDSSIPFSYLDDKQSYQGYSVDLCQKVVFAIQRYLDMPTLKTNLNPVTSATRIPLMANGTIDLECGSTTNNLERQKQVAFGPTMFVTATR